jgi:hypothetical protein
MSDPVDGKLGELIEIPRNPGPCPSCARPLRLSTRAEVVKDLEDPRTRHVALQAAHGRIDWTPPEELGGEDWSHLYEGGTWLFRCDACGNRTLVCRPLITGDT